MSKSFDTEKFIEKAKKIHCDKYDYSKVEYVNCRTKVCIICPEHGEFWQKPSNHLEGYGCPKCGSIKNKEKTTCTIDKFIEKANIIHSNKYDYTESVYKNSYTKIKIKCKEHGYFYQTPHEHLKGFGCPYCGNKRTTKEDFIKKSNQVHNGKYIYDKVIYTNSSTKVCIICPEHGEFWQTPNNHLNGHGCPCCGKIKYSNSRNMTTSVFVERAKQIHGDKYDYSETEYIDIFSKVCIICKKHGKFWQRANDHINLNCGCPKCRNVISKPENDIVEYLHSLSPQQRNRIILKGKEIDIYIPSLSLGIEYNGLRWHSEEFGKDRNYHLDKLNECNNNGFKLIQIFEDEWVNHREICESKLKQICGLNTNPKIYGRKCEIKLIDNKSEAYEFLDNNHIQGRTGFTVALGAYYDDKLVGVMAFKREKDGYWDLNRFATDIHYHCIGIGGKLFKYFTTHYDFQEIKSFADRRWTINPNDNLYTKLGFEFDSFVEPSYTYYNLKTSKSERHHKFSFRKQILSKKYGFPLEMTELEMTKELGYTRIWDCGLIKYVYLNK